MRVLVGTLGVLVIVIALVAVWYFRPWSEYSPHRIVSMQSGMDRTTMMRSQHLMFPTRRIASSDRPRSWPRNVRSLDIEYDWNGERRTLEDYISSAEVTGLMVLLNGEVVYETYRRGADENTLFSSASVAKSYTATVLAIAVKEGRVLSLDDRVVQYAPQYSGSAYQDVTLRHLLMMASGIDFQPEEKWGPFTRWGKTYFDVWFNNREMDRVAADLGRLTPPGKSFVYRFPDTHVISAVIRGAYPEFSSYAKIVEEKLWKPFGFGGEAFWVQNRAGDRGQALGHCCLSMRLMDFAHLGQIYLEDGEWNGVSHFPDDWVEGVSRPNAAYQEPGYNQDRYPDAGYSRQFWIPKDYDGEFYAAGAFGQYIWVDVERDVVVAQTAAEEWDVEFSTTVSSAEKFRVWRSIAAAVSK